MAIRIEMELLVMSTLDLIKREILGRLKILSENKLIEVNILNLLVS